jgi:cysteinyl-tRNA synthetase
MKIILNSLFILCLSNNIKLSMMNIYDTLSKQQKQLPREKIIKWYMCGPTVYDHAHIGHARNYITNDILIRILDYFGYNICLTMNITDVDDKIINKANELYQNQNEWKTISSIYEKSFVDDMLKLNINMPHFITRVSDYIPEIISFIEDLITNGHAYKSQSSSSVYFDTKSFYEKFSDGFDVPPSELNEEISDTTYLHEKKDMRDFALWKSSKPNEPYWDSPWGKGRPGWHIECSAMSHSIFGDHLTMHSGGIDLKFPHHENERKQCVAKSQNSHWTDFFIHIGHLHIQGKKMSKSLKNFITIKDILQRYTSDDLRMFCLMHKYSDNIDFNDEHLAQVALTVKKIKDFLSRTEYFVKDDKYKYLYKKNDPDVIIKTISIKYDIDNDLLNDFDTPSAIKKILNMIEMANTYESNYQVVSIVYNHVVKIFSMFGMQFVESAGNSNDLKLINIIDNFRNNVRNYAKKNKQGELYTITDDVRNELSKIGTNLTDDKK